MNRIVVIGNGFDKAHGLATGYKDFIDAYWSEFAGHIFGGYSRWQTATYGELGALSHYKDEFAEFKIVTEELLQVISKTSVNRPDELWTKEAWNYNDMRRFISWLNGESIVRNVVSLTFTNEFFGHISNCYYLTNWLDIENEYYEKLKELLVVTDKETRHQKVIKLNQEFEAVKKLLEKYLMQIVENVKPYPISSIQKAFESFIEPQDIAHRVRADFIEYVGKKSGTLNMEADQEEGSLFDAMFKPIWQRHMQTKLYRGLLDDGFKAQYCQPENTLLLNFNYTDIAERLYEKDCKDIIHIHGELGNARNPIIFGYGDELDEEYKRIERLQDNDFLENIKSIRYHETGNYQKVLGFLEADLYQVVVMGHSCGNSDRTLLNTLLEHPNCASVKVYYHQIDNNTDNYSQIVRNLSRNFNDKAAMRDKVVNKELCSPLVPINQKTT